MEKSQPNPADNKSQFVTSGDKVANAAESLDKDTMIKKAQEALLADLDEQAKEKDKNKPISQKAVTGKEKDGKPPASDKQSEAEKPKAPTAPGKQPEADKPKAPPTSDKQPGAEKPKAPTAPDKQPEVEKPKAPTAPGKQPEADKPKVPPTSDKQPEAEKPKAPTAPDKHPEADKPKAPPAPGKQPEADKPKAPSAPDKQPEAEKLKAPPKPETKLPTAGKAQDGNLKAPDKDKAPDKPEAPPVPAAPEQPTKPRETPRREAPEQIVYLKLDELHAFKNHPFKVRDDSEMKALMESVREKGVNQPAIVRPRPDGGFEIIAGHRRQFASRLAGFTDIPCIVRNLTDDEAVLAMTDDNLRQREQILPMEKAFSLKMQVDAIKHQGARSKDAASGDAGKRSVAIVGERNNMDGKQVQRYISLTKLVPDLMTAVNEKKLSFTPAVEISGIKPKNQNYIVVAMKAEETSPSLSQAKRMRELDQKGELNGDVIDGILGEQKKEEIRVIITGAELDKYFGKDKTPQDMKGQIIKLLDEWSAKEKALTPPVKFPGKEK